jgi:indolepyruvate ferredoxin oxidoreductase alpha subunit
VGWSLNEAVAAAVGHGHSRAGARLSGDHEGSPGCTRRGTSSPSGARFVRDRGALIYYIATISPLVHPAHPRSALTVQKLLHAVFEPRSHQELHEAARDRRGDQPRLQNPGG